MEQESSPKKRKFLVTPSMVLLVIVALVVLSTAGTAFYKVDESEQAVITRLGKYYKTVGPGLQFKIPFGIDKHYIVPVTQIQTEQFGMTKTNQSKNSNYFNNNSTYTMLTGDLNIVDVEWIIQYRIVDPVAWLFNVQDKVETIRDISQSVINALVGDRAILDVISSERVAIEVAAMEEMNITFDQIGLGIDVNAVLLQNIVPPTSVQDAFEDVNRAQQDAERFINEGKEIYNKEIPLAQGIASQQIQVAEGYAIERVNQAKGDVEKFNALYEEYEKSSQVTRNRMYLETMETVFSSRENATLIDGELDNILPVKTLTGNTSGGTN